MKKSGQANAKVEVVEPMGLPAKFQLWFPELNAGVAQSLATIHSELMNVSKTVVLVPSVFLKNAESSLIADSVFASRLIAKSLIINQPLFDIAAGSGFPGLIFALLYPAHSVIIVDRDPKRLEFCKIMVARLELKNVSFQVCLPDDLPEKSVFNLVNRGPAPLARVLLAGRKTMAKTGRFFHIKGDGWANELAQLPSQLFSHWSPNLLGQYRLPESTSSMFVVRTDKTSD